MIGLENKSGMMKKREFDEILWRVGDAIVVNGVEFVIISVDFEKKRVFYKDSNGEKHHVWAKNIESIKQVI